MTFPSGSGANFQIQLDFILNDKDVIARVEAETKGITDETKKAAIATKILREEVEKIAPGYIDAKKAAEAVNEQNKTMLLQARNLKAQVREANAELRIMRDNARDIDLLAKPLALGGALLVGGIFAAASKYVKDSKEATATTIAWKAAEDDAAKSGEKIGAVLAKEALPVLKEGTQLLSKFAGFLEANPEVAGFALKAGLVALTLGTIGKALASGIHLVADFKQDAIMEAQLRAAQLQLAASDNQLRAAGIQAEASGAGNAGKLGGSGIAAGLASPVGVAVLGAGALLAASKLDDAFQGLEKTLSGLGDAGKISSGIIGGLENVLGATSLPLLGIVSAFKGLPAELSKINDELKKLFGIDISKLFGGGSTPTSAAAPVSLLGGSQETQDKLVAAYAKYKEEDLALVEKHYSDRQDIISGALADEQKANSDLAAKISDIATKINKAESDATANFNEQNLRAQQDYNDKRAEIISSGNDDILKIQQDSQDRIKKLRQDFEDKAVNDRNRRDALALVRDRKDLNKGISEEQASTNKEIARRKADTALRLRELDAQFAKEKQRRLEDYQQRIAELEQQRVEESKQAQVAHDAEIKRIESQEKDKLAKLDAAYNEERTHRYKAFITQINDLDKYLLGTSAALNASYAANLASLNQWIANVKQSLGTLTGAAGGTLTGYSTGGGTVTTGTTSTFWQSFLSNLGIHDEGGYMTKGVARVAWNGVPEFAFSGASTKAAEQIVSGKLTQQNALAAMARGMQGGNVTLNDHRRFDGQITNAERRAIQEDTKKTYSKLLAGMAA